MRAASVGAAIRVIDDAGTSGDALPYPIHVGHALLGRLPAIVPALEAAHRVVVVTDTTVAAHHAAPLVRTLGEARTLLLTVAPGERAKSRAQWAALTDAMLAAGVGRDAVVVALGGGVVGDLAGFVAATFLRGIPVVQCPTTLLAMVDASIGGKTGVDTPSGKNLVGAFHPPLAVVADLDVLATLPATERAQGLAESLKHGVVADTDYWNAVTHALPWPDDGRTLHALVAGSARIKSGVVARDPHERGERAILNFGHTIAHAIERLRAFAMPHGEAVAIGMVVEAMIAERTGHGDASVARALRDALPRAGLPVHVPADLDADAIVAATAGDKKSRAGIVRYALPAAIGRMARDADGQWAIAVAPDVVRDALLAARAPA